MKLSPVPILLLLPTLVAAEEAPSPREVLLSERVLNVAHRGGAAEAPEATLSAFQSAARQGADVLELDVRRSSDGAIVVCHDATVDRTTNGKGKVAEKTLAELQALDAGYRFSPDGGKSFPHRGKGVRIPTFRQVLDAFPRMPFVVEIKPAQPGIVPAVLAVADAAGAADRIVFSSAHDAVLAAVRKAKPGALTGFARDELIAFSRLSREAEKTYRPPGDYLQAPAMFVTKAFVERAERHGLRVHAWTVNDERDMRRLIALGVEGIMTDHPARLAKLLPKPTQRRRSF